MRIPFGERRPDLYRGQLTLPYQHPNGYEGGGLRLRDSQMQEQPYDSRLAYPETGYYPSDPQNLLPAQPTPPMHGQSFYRSGPQASFNVNPFPQGAGPDPRYNAPPMNAAPTPQYPSVMPPQPPTNRPVYTGFPPAQPVNQSMTNRPMPLLPPAATITGSLSPARP